MQNISSTIAKYLTKSSIVFATVVYKENSETCIVLHMHVSTFKIFPVHRSLRQAQTLK